MTRPSILQLRTDANSIFSWCPKTVDRSLQHVCVLNWIRRIWQGTLICCGWNLTRGWLNSNLLIWMNKMIQGNVSRVHSVHSSHIFHSHMWTELWADWTNGCRHTFTRLSEWGTCYSVFFFAQPCVVPRADMNTAENPPQRNVTRSTSRGSKESRREFRLATSPSKRERIESKRKDVNPTRTLGLNNTPIWPVSEDSFGPFSVIKGNYRKLQLHTKQRRSNSERSPFLATAMLLAFTTDKW